MAKKIMWDKGHGGIDPGAVDNGLKEADLTNIIVDHAMVYMTLNYTGFEQRATRSIGQTLDLARRDDEANKWGANVFVSVHINAGGGTGFETFIYNGGAPASTVSLQNTIHAEILAAMRKFGNVVDRGKKRANFAVLRETNMDAVLTENLFIDTTVDANKLKNNAFLKAVGEAHARGVAKFLKLQEKPKQVNRPTNKNEGVVVVAGKEYEDIANSWGKDAIIKAIEKGVIPGYDDGTWRPNQPIKRADIAVILDRLGLLK